MDYDLSTTQRLWGRYTHDLSETLRARRAVLRHADSGRRRHRDRVPGQVAPFGVRSIIGSNRLNELNYHFSSNNIRPRPPKACATPSADFGITDPRGLSRRTSATSFRSSMSPGSACSAPTSCSAFSTSITRSRDNFSWQRGNHALKFGGLATFEQKNENAASVSQGRFGVRGHGRRRHRLPELPARQRRRPVHRLQLHRGRARHRHAAALQPLRVLRAGHVARRRRDLTVDYGVRYSLYPPITDKNNQLVTFDPSLYNAAAAPPFANRRRHADRSHAGDLLSASSRAA